MKDVALPPMTHETVLLDLDRLSSTTYNIMQTVIAVNAIDSEREGAVSIVAISVHYWKSDTSQDYLFSPQVGG